MLYYIVYVLSLPVNCGSCLERCTRRSNLYLPEVGQHVWPKHVAALYSKRERCALTW